MIEDPPLVTIRRQWSRPTKDQLRCCEEVPTVHFVDAMGGRGALDYRIRPLSGTKATPLVGPALTCHCGPADNLAMFAAVATAQPGDVLIVSTDGFTETCLTGDLLLRMASHRGVAALVTDGLVRDVAAIRDVGIPVYCRGISANSPVRNGPGTVGMPISLGAVSVNSGDIVVADEDGVVVVPFVAIAQILPQIAAIDAAEREFDQAVKGGLAIPEFIATLLKSDQVRYLDE